MSIDGYASDAEGNFGWSAPSSPVFDSHVQRLGDVTCEILGRKTYELMKYWETYDEVDGTDAEHEFARRWRALDKRVVSSTMAESQLVSARDTLLPSITVDEIKNVVEEDSGVVEIFGPTTAAEAIRVGIVDVFDFFVVPKMVGGGLRVLPDDFRCDLRLSEHRIFDNGVAYLRYEPE